MLDSVYQFKSSDPSLYVDVEHVSMRIWKLEEMTPTLFTPDIHETFIK